VAALALAVPITAVFVKLEENPPGWLLRNPLGRWLRR
jgi:hypothetical protein